MKVGKDEEKKKMVHVVGVDTQSDIGGVGFIHTCLSS